MDPQQRLLAEARYLLAEAGYAALRLRRASALVTMQMEEQKQRFIEAVEFCRAQAADAAKPSQA